LTGSVVPRQAGQEPGRGISITWADRRDRPGSGHAPAWHAVAYELRARDAIGLCRSAWLLPAGNQTRNRVVARDYL